MKSADCTVVELRRYRLHPGARDTLIELFDREFVESQEAVGMHLLGQFRDLDDLDSFIFGNRAGVFARCFLRRKAGLREIAQQDKDQCQ